MNQDKNTIFNLINNAILDENAGKCGEWTRSYIAFMCKTNGCSTWEELLTMYKQ